MEEANMHVGDIILNVNADGSVTLRRHSTNEGLTLLPGEWFLVMQLSLACGLNRVPESKTRKDVRI